MKILVVGGGGREHALVWKLAQSPKVQQVFVAPGNAGTVKIATNLDLVKTKEIVDWAKDNRPDLVVVGPDSYLAEGIVDQLLAFDIKVFGPTKAAAEIEWSKSFAKQLMVEEGIPTASFKIFTDFEQALAYVKTQKFPLVIKVDGLALGKGVIIARTIFEAEEALKNIMQQTLFGAAGQTVVIEEFLVGREISIHAFCDAGGAQLFPSAQDHKRIFAGDQGPNTGGMGTISPVPGVTESEMKVIADQVVLPTLRALKNRGRTFRGLLYPGVMLTADGPKVIEFNARFGDPETQSYMRLLESDLVDILLACAGDTLAEQKIKWSDQPVCCIVLASGGYPGEYEKGKVISGLDVFNDLDIEIFHAGTKFDNQGQVVTSGGRVLGITAVGEDLELALAKAYQAIKAVSFEGMQYREDVGVKTLDFCTLLK